MKKEIMDSIEIDQCVFGDDILRARKFSNIQKYVSSKGKDPQIPARVKLLFSSREWPGKG